MVDYVYIVKSHINDSCGLGDFGDEVFSTFDEAKDFAMSVLNCSPYIMQVEIVQDDFGHSMATESGQIVWDYEGVNAAVAEEEPEEEMIWTKDDLNAMSKFNWDETVPDSDLENSDIDVPGDLIEAAKQVIAEQDKPKVDFHDALVKLREADERNGDFDPDYDKYDEE